MNQNNDFKCQIWFTEYHNNNVALSVRIKDILYREKSEFQEIEIVDSYDFGKVLILDNTFQTTERDEFIYHELISHIPLFTHPNPKRVLVIGGGDGGTVREVVKHDSVEVVDFVELDKKVIEACKKYMPKLSCEIENEKVNVLITDGIKYVAETENKYDVIIVDCPDPVGPAKGLFEKEFYKNIYKCLDDDGIMVQQSESPLYNLDLIQNICKYLKEAGFEIIKPYTYPMPTYPSGFWSFTLASKKHDPLETDEKKIKEKLKDIKTKYYDEEVHKGIFLATPKFLKDAVKKALE
ncbi:spermidine synthase [Methanocaldococcus vulcanius M7]|uniref:Polyamine aminopropyltransferase n=1 Tax=Methanocaldococcus vulcanius (strain ATCC 700851 / DSM 12094 / M7) TaxID=579137 RepID=C9RFK8_METVM|nr:spermidine synthase [Methanocaldococcus vulcanius]ACX72360.1 spermidine synthase [Methanocaldococcus vulcanius M7]